MIEDKANKANSTNRGTGKLDQPKKITNKQTNQQTNKKNNQTNKKE